MHRRTAYNGEMPISADFLQAQQNAMVGLAKLAESILGTSAIATGLGCTPTTPTASLAVVLAAGNLYQQVALEATTWSSLPSDTTDLIVKQGIQLTAQTLPALTPPSTSGFSQVFLIEAQYQDFDTNAKVLPYFNPAVLTTPGAANWSGPGNSGASQATDRQGIVAIQVKAGTAAATGTQVAPIADTGWVPLYLVTLANGQTQITSGSIAVAPGAPFLPSTLPGIGAYIQSGAPTSVADTGSVNALAVAPVPAPAAITNGMQFCVKVAHTVTGAATLQVTLASGSTQTNAITRADASALQPSDVLGGAEVNFTFDGTEWQIAAPTVGARRTAVADVAYSAKSTDRIVAYTALTASRAVALPAAAAFPQGEILWIVDETGNASASKSITVNRNGSDTIDNATSAAISGPYGILGLESNGSNAWTVIHSRINTFGRTPVADAAYTMLLGDRTVAYTSLTAARIVSLLPAASYAPGTTISIRDDIGLASGALTLSAAPSGTDTINGSNTTQVVVNGAYGETALETDGVSKWFIAKTSPVKLQNVARILLSTTVNFNVANTDTPIPIALPAGFSNYLVLAVRIGGASASLTSATAGLFTAAAGGGVAIVTAASAITLSTASPNTNNNTMVMSINNTTTESYNAASLFFRVAAAEGSAATATVTIEIAPVA